MNSPVFLQLFRSVSGSARGRSLRQPWQPPVVAALVVAGIALLASPMTAQAQEPAAVTPQPGVLQTAAAAGEVVFVTGQARVTAADGSHRALVAGMPIHAGDRIGTDADTWVHLRMADQAFVAVRPDSRFVVARYDFDPAQPQASRIRLQLDEGNARTVSGRGGEAAREHYRFGTPVAAIGLRGTDYTVRTTDDFTRVSVARGAVVVTPLGAGCQADALGPCQTLASRELSAALPHAYLEVNTRNPLPVLVTPAQDPAGAAGQNPPGAPAEPHATRSAPSASASTSAETVGDTNADRILVSAGQTPAYPPEVTAPGAGLPLVWGRWSKYAGGDGSPALVNVLADREVLFGNEVFGLLRARGDLALPSQGVVSFQLGASEAYAVRGPVMTPAAVLGGDLDVDFRQRVFSTGLAVRHGDTIESLYAQGAVDARGLLTSERGSWSMTVRGGLAQDLQSAAYLFDKPLSGGSLLGAVRWTR